MSSTTVGARICYTTNGATPTATSGVCGPGSTTYTGPVPISSSQTIKALAGSSTLPNSAVTTGVYTINTSTLTIFINGKFVFSGTVQIP
jgi:hypothetical protein